MINSDRSNTVNSIITVVVVYRHFYLGKCKIKIHLKMKQKHNNNRKTNKQTKSLHKLKYRIHVTFLELRGHERAITLNNKRNVIFF